MPPHRVITATAPTRICDLGGWTDTSVARHGCVFNIAVQPNVRVQIDVWPRNTCASRVTINAENFGLRYSPALDGSAWGPHPMLEAPLRAIRSLNDVDIEATIRSEAPPGASTGTSAAVLVALIAALDRLAGGRCDARQIAARAHRVETSDLGRPSGVQDQLCSALGGVNFIRIVEYPHAEVSRIELPRDAILELERRLVLVYLGRPHSSSDVHAQVMRELERLGPDCAPLAVLRRAAERGRNAAAAADLVALGRAMTDNTMAQAELHPDLVHHEAWRVGAVAMAHGGLGWKVNGAGWDGGSITILCGDGADAKDAMMRAIGQENHELHAIPVTLSQAGVQVWDRIEAIDQKS